MCEVAKGVHKVVLNKGKIEISMVLTHEQRVLTSFLRWDSLEQNFGN
jgi:hypothetical protein